MLKALVTRLVAVGLAAALASGCTNPANTTGKLPTKAELQAQFEATMMTARSTDGPGEPALWRLGDEDTDIYLFGTVHLLRPDITWRSPAFDAAFDAADTIVFEVDVKTEAGQKALMRDFVSRGFFKDGETLRSVLDDDVEPTVEAALLSVGMPLDAVNAMKPWMVSAQLGVMKLQQDGYDPNSGIEAVLQADATASGKTFDFLEQASDQADAFDLLPQEAQVAFLYETAVLLEESPRMLDQLVAEWADGDVAGLGAIVAEPNAVGMDAAIYQALLVTRNARWVPQIESMLETPGTTMIAVGAAHLAGPDSVVAMLRTRGHEIAGP